MSCWLTSARASAGPLVDVGGASAAWGPPFGQRHQWSEHPTALVAQCLWLSVPVGLPLRAGSSSMAVIDFYRASIQVWAASRAHSDCVLCFMCVVLYVYRTFPGWHER